MEIVIIDTLAALSVWALHRVGLFREGNSRAASIEWREQGTGRPVLSAKITADGSGATIAYTYNGREDRQRVGVCMRPANIGGGCVPVFVCPVTGKYCRTLYFVGGRFVSRFAFRGRYYSQTVGERGRLLSREREARNKENALIDEIPRRRLTYAGRPTRYALRLDAQSKKTERLGREVAFFRLLNRVPSE